MSTAANALPGRRRTFAATLAYLAVLVVVPLIALIARTASTPWHRVVQIVSSRRVVAALRLSLVSSAIAAAVAVVLALVIAWALGRYRFRGHALLDAAVEIPLALPTSVAGITMASLYGEHGPLGGLFARLGIKVALAPAGIVLVLVFVGLPFAVRAIQGVVHEMNEQVEEAASSLGASRLQTLWRLHLPVLAPSMVTAFTLAFARGVGEYGSVIFIAGNLPYKTEIGPLLVVTKLEQFDYDGAAVIALILLLAAVFVLALTQALERWTARRLEGGGRQRGRAG